jgi:hypothetical protein
MLEFGRKLSKKFMEQLASDVALRENAWMCDMLRYWRPAGDLIGKHLGEQDALQTDGHVLEENPKHLRLAVRDGSVNFYRAGQSVAKVGLNRWGKLQATIHNKYVYGKDAKGQGYVTLTSAGFRELRTGRPVRYDGIARLDEWIRNANCHIGEEKSFVDAVVARNQNVIDLEVGLPAYSDVREERRAPRMDLAALERIGHSWRIVFWEAKLVGDGRARCSGPVIPKYKPEVLKQLGDYTDWLRHDKNCESVVLAYRNTCCLLVAFHTIARRFNPDIEELGAGIQAIATPGAPPPEIDDRPRLLIDARKPNHSFTEHGHLKKLREAGVHVQMIQGDDQMTLETRS